MSEPPQKAQPFSLQNWPGMILGLFTLAGVGLVTLGQIGTVEAIAERRAEDLQRSLAQVIPGKHHDNDLLQNLIELELSGLKVSGYQGKLAGQTSAIAFSVTANDGYGGPMEILLGIDAKGHLLGVRVLSHTETPGLGDKIEANKSDWILDFNGRGLDNLSDAEWAVKKDGGRFDAFSGATITPRAVVKAVYGALKSFENQRHQLILEQQTPLKETK